MTELDFDPLPEMEDMEVITSGAGTGSGHTMIANYHELLEQAIQLWQYHFEFLNLGYAAYLDFFGFCKQAWPSIPDLAIAKMVAGVDVDLFRPDDELKRLARKAVEDGLAERFSSRDVDTTCQLLKADDAGQGWIAEWDKACEPWFNFSTGSGFYHSDKIWIENVEVPFGYITDYIAKVEEGVDLNRPVEALHAERDRVVTEYRDLLDSDEDRAAFDGKLGLLAHGVPLRREPQLLRRALGALGDLAQDAQRSARSWSSAGFFEKPDDVFLLKRNEVADALFDYYAGWAVGAPSRGPAYWPKEIERRRADAGRAAGVEPAAGARRAAGGRHRALHGHALGHHLRLGLRLAEGRRRRGRRRVALRLRGLARAGRGSGSRDHRTPTASPTSRRARSWWLR